MIRLLIPFLIVMIVAQSPAATAIFARKHLEPFTIIQIGDMHGGSSPIVSGVAGVSFTNSINWIVNNREAMNIKMLISAGDCYEQRQNGILSQVARETIPIVLKEIQDTGISVFVCPGNHDADDDTATILWNTQFPTNWFTNDPSFYTTRTNDDSRDLVFRQTNSGMKFLIIGYRWHGTQEGLSSEAEVWTNYYDPTQWIKDEAALLPDHQVIVVAHYFVNEDGELATEDDAGGYPFVGPGLAGWEQGLNEIPNMLMGVCGHTRTTAATVKFYHSEDTHRVPFLKFNTQSAFNLGFGTNGGSFKVYTFIPDERQIHAQTYSTDFGRYLTNGEWGATHDFYIPWKYVD